MPTNEYSVEKENAALQEARSDGLSKHQVDDLRKEFEDGRKVHEMIRTLILSNFSRFRTRDFKAFRDIIVLLQHKDSEILAKLFDKILGMPIFAKALHSRSFRSGTTLLHEAALCGHDEVVKKLLESGFDPSVKTTGTHRLVFVFETYSFNYKIKSGKNYLEFAHIGHEWCIKKTLHMWNADQLFARCFYHYQQRNIPLTDHRMIGAIEDVNQLEEDGQTLLHLALTNHFSIPVILALLEKGANPLVADNLKQTALDKLISMRGHLFRDNYRWSIMLALFLDAAGFFDPENLDKYEKIREEKILDKNFIYFLLLSEIISHLGDELRISKSLKEPYNPLRFAFKRAADPKRSLESAYDQALWYLSDDNVAKNEEVIDAIKTFVLPLFEERRVLTKQALNQLPNYLPLVLYDIIVSYLIN